MPASAKQEDACIRYIHTSQRAYLPCGTVLLSPTIWVAVPPAMLRVTMHLP